MEEKVLHLSENMRYWNKAKPGMTKLNTYLGKLLVTNQQLYFLSSGSSKLSKQIATGLIFGNIAGNLILGKSLTKDLDISALDNKGSFQVSISDIQRFVAKRRWDFGAYLSIQTIAMEKHAFMKDPYGFAFKEMKQIAELITQIKPNNPS